MTIANTSSHMNRQAARPVSVFFYQMPQWQVDKEAKMRHVLAILRVSVPIYIYIYTYTYTYTHTWVLNYLYRDYF